VLDKNLRERHIRGGIATRKKYQKIREAHSSFAAPDQNTD
jgi:hypothetical protein